MKTDAPNPHADTDPTQLSAARPEIPPPPPVPSFPPDSAGRLCAVVERLSERLDNVEQTLLTTQAVLLRLQAELTPKYVRVGGWVTIAGSVLGAAVKYLTEGG